MKPRASLSLDLDDLWAYQCSFGIEGWQQRPSFLAVAIPRILQCLEQLNLKTTVFIVGSDAEKPELRPLFQQLTAQGHEVGNHSLHHRVDLHTLPAEQIVADLQQADAAITAATGQAPIGFRGPAFGLSQTVLDVLAELNYQYDASLFSSSLDNLATWYQRQGHKQQQGAKLTSQPTPTDTLNGATGQAPFFWELDSGSLLELPVSTLPYLRFPLHGTYLQFLADHSPFLARQYWSLCLKLFQVNKATPSFLLHATDFIGCDDSFALDYLPGMKRTATEKVTQISQVLASLQQKFEVVSLNELARQLSAESVLTSSRPSHD